MSRCTQPEEPTTVSPTTAVPAAPVPASASLRIQVEPEGALILVDGLHSGTAPISLTLAAGEHVVRAEKEGYEPLVWTVNLSAGGRETLNGQMASLAGPTATPAPSEPPQPTQPLADLLPQRASIELETGGACVDGATDLGVRVWIENAGAAAGPFVVEVNGVQVSLAEGLAAGQSTSVWVAGYRAGQENVAVVDVTSAVPESNEENNAFSAMLPIPTLPPACTATPGVPVTPPPPATPGPQASATPMPGPPATPTATPQPAAA
ncbi:MAG TPA: PEGA domain-containing protein, partial [Anaerolineae bacterium]|nr:PEGA domain-containing protein [Anaerolineae bacterium]